METDDFDLCDWLDMHDTYYEEDQEWQELTIPQDIKEKAAS